MSKEIDFEKFKSAFIITIARSMNIEEMTEAVKDVAEGLRTLLKRREEEDGA